MSGSPVVGVWRRATEATAEGAIRCLAGTGASQVVLLTVTAMAGAWGVTFLAGGTRTVFPHLFYVPVMIAAAGFGRRPGVLVAVAAALAAGPLMPADHPVGAAQPLTSWLTRLALFVAMALFVAWMAGYHRPELRRSVSDSDLARELRTGLAENQLTVFYQPQVDLATGRIVGLEALVRWRHPARGLVLPGEFVPAAERTGLIRDIDNFVLGQAVRQLANWTRAGHQDVTLAVNFSACRLRDPRLVSDVASRITGLGLDPGRIHLEVTETAVISDIAAAADRIAALRALGVRVAIDDFGAGQASFRYLHRFSVDFVKIDRAYVAGVIEDARANRLVGGMIKLIDSLDVTPVGEGIETAEQLREMQALGCTIGQGFHLARPGDSDLTGRRLDLNGSAVHERSGWAAGA